MEYLLLLVKSSFFSPGEEILKKVDVVQTELCWYQKRTFLSFSDNQTLL